MLGSAVSCFADVRDYAKGLRELDAIITPMRTGDFAVQFIRVDLPLLRLMRAKESAPRIAFISIPKLWRYVLFLARPCAPLTWNGEVIGFGEIMLTGDGERLHQRTIEAASIDILALPAQMLRRYADGLSGRRSTIPSEGSIVKIPKPQMQNLLRLHTRIARLIQTRPITICHPEAARSIEQELIEVFVTALVNGETREMSPFAQGAGRTLTQLEDFLAQHSGRVPTTRDMSVELGVSEPVLASYCLSSFDMSPHRYASEQMKTRSVRRLAQSA